MGEGRKQSEKKKETKRELTTAGHRSELYCWLTWYGSEKRQKMGAPLCVCNFWQQLASSACTFFPALALPFQLAGREAHTL